MYFEDYQIGQQWTVAEFTITADEIHSFAERYDPLPLHTDDEFAAKSRFQGLIASGPLGFLSLWSHYQRQVTDFAEGLIAGIRSSSEYLKPIYAGDILRGQVTVVSVKQRNPYNGAVIFDSEITNQDKQCVTRGKIEVCFELREPRIIA